MRQKSAGGVTLSWFVRAVLVLPVWWRVPPEGLKSPRFSSASRVGGRGNHCNTHGHAARGGNHPCHDSGAGQNNSQQGPVAAKAEEAPEQIISSWNPPEQESHLMWLKR
ncbi:hypothetical protein AD948_09150 [Acetobacter senegalensis]|uniref:Uncharacterized protein n=1 Tax=Acetobacter senegalensis TaxID=446692 RepID=A0A149U1P0_9PROT|nr:hypothetical protein AD948_09150 [Acetobacter senegalensis]